MPESPDFEQIAREMARGLVVLRVPTHLHDAFVRDHAEQLRLVWNARGAADIAKLEALEVIPDHVSDDALRSLDR